MVNRVVIIVICLMILVNFTLIIIPNSTNALGGIPPPFYVRWDPGMEKQEADVGPGDSGMVLFTGVVHCEYVADGTFEKIIVLLYTASEQGWSTIIEPTTMVFNQTTDVEIPFSVTVTIPPKASFYVTDTIQMTGRATAYPGNYSDIIDPLTATIKVKQYYDFNINTENSFQKIEKGNNVVYNLNIINMGNARDIYQISVNNLRELEKAGFEIIVLNKIEIDHNETKYIDLIIKTPNDIQPGRHKIDISVRSEQEERNEGYTSPHNITLTLEVEQDDYSFFLIIGMVILIILVSILAFTWKKRRKVKGINK